MSNVADPAAMPVPILVVEDETLVHELIEPALSEAGYAVHKATNGEEALSFIDKDDAGSLRALVTDINLGVGPTGWDLAKRARELHPDLPVVYMTGAAASEWSSKGVPNSLLIQKPFAPAQIVAAVSHLLNAPPSGAPAT
jgi:DNA-binding response OmpR family regulator